MVGIQEQSDRIFRGDFKGVFNPSKTVSIEKNQADKNSLQSDHLISLCAKAMDNVDDRIAIAETTRIGYKAAVTFVHEYRHQYQFKHDDINHYKGNLSLAENILDD